MKLLLLLMLIMNLLYSFQNKEYITKNDDRFEIRNRYVLSQYKNVEEMKEAYLEAFWRNGMEREHYMLKNFNYVNKEYYPSPLPSTWIENINKSDTYTN